MGKKRVNDLIKLIHHLAYTAQLLFLFSLTPRKYKQKSHLMFSWVPNKPCCCVFLFMHIDYSTDLWHHRNYISIVSMWKNIDKCYLPHVQYVTEFTKLIVHVCIYFFGWTNSLIRSRFAFYVRSFLTVQYFQTY